MELTYQRQMILPANCYALSEDEMTYLDGGEYTFGVGKYNVTIDPSVLPQYALNFAVNTAYVLGMGITSATIAGVVKGYKDGLSLSQTADHYFGNMNTAGRVAIVVVGVPFAGFYIYNQAMSIYSTIVTVVDAVKEWKANRDAAKAGTEVAVAA